MLTPRSGESGFTLIELMVSLVLGLIVIAAAGDLLVNATQRSTEVADRTDSTGRARVAVDSIVRDLQGEVCLSPTQPPIGAGSSSRSVTFTADLSGSSAPGTVPSKVQISYVPDARDGATTGTLRRTVWPGTGSPPDTVFTSPPISNGVEIDDAFAPDGGPVFTYYAYNDTAPALALTEVVPDATTGLSLADARRIVRVAVHLGASPPGKPASDARSTVINDDAWIGTAEGDEASLGPQC